MRRCLAVLAALLHGASAFPSAAAAAPSLVVWQGDATVTVASQACASTTSERQTIGVGTVLRSLYRPAGLGANGDDTRISFNHDSQSNFAVLIAGAPAAGTYTSFGVKYDGVLVANQGGAFRRFASIPDTVTASTVFFEFVGTIETFMFIPGCTVSFRAAYAPRP